MQSNFEDENAAPGVQTEDGKVAAPQRDYNTDREKVAIIAQEYPGFDQSLYSKTKRPDYYGIELVANAKMLIGAKKHRKRREQNGVRRFTFRAGKQLANRMSVVMRAYNYRTSQEFIAVAVQRFCESLEEE